MRCRSRARRRCLHPRQPPPGNSRVHASARFSRAYLSHNRMEWWFGHLTTALARHVEIVACPMVRFNQPGHRVDADLSTLIDADGQPSFYLGSSDQLFGGITELRMPTAIWSDYIPQSPAPVPAYFRLFDVVFYTQKDIGPVLRQAGLSQAEWLPFAFDATLRNDPDAERIYDIGFVGSLEQPATRAERVQVLARLEGKYRLNDYRRAAFGDDMMRVYNQSRIAVNVPVPGGFNMRTFEAMAAGALLLTRAVGNGQEDFFRDGVHLVTYRDSDDLIDKVDYFLRNDAERREIAANGMREVLARHTYDHRAAQLLETMTKSTPARARDRAARLSAYADFYDYLGRPDLLAAVALARGVPPLKRLRLLTRAAVKCGRAAVDFRNRPELLA